MTDEPSLLAAILDPANRDEDLPRLLYADWLDEQAAERGESIPTPRAEFIRVQCELAKMPSSSRKANSRKMRSRRAKLLAFENRLMGCGDIRSMCAQPLSEWGHDMRTANPEYGGRRVVWDRGFVCGLDLPAADWLTHAEAILAAHPVRKVTLTTMPEFERPENALRDVYQLRGRRGAWIVWPGEYIQPYLLHKEWPTVEFELPGDSYWPHTSPAE